MKVNFCKIAVVAGFFVSLAFAQSNPDSTTQLKTPAPGNLTLVGVGDIMMGLNYPEDDMILPKNEGSETFSEVKGILQDADVTFGNLEGVLLNEGGTPKPCCRSGKKSQNCWCFRTPESYVQHLVDAGFDVLSVSNNHAGDFGADGRACTQKVLNSSGIAFAGFENSSEYTVFEKNGVKFGFAAFSVSSGTMQIFDTEKVKRTVKLLRDSSDIVIVSMHVGAEGAKYTHVTKNMEIFLGDKRGNPYEFARMVIDAGADVVFGHGPHVPRAMDVYKGKFIAYSLGNFSTSTNVNISGVSGYAPIVKITIDKSGNFVEGTLYSNIQKGAKGNRKPYRDEKGACIKLMKQLTEEDVPESPLAIGDDGKLTVK